MITPNPIAVRALAIARAQIGKPYLWGASGPAAFDCSGLCIYSYRTAGHYLPRYTDAGLATAGVRVSQAALLPGDLVRPHVGHIQIYAGAGRILEAARAGVPVREVAMWGFLDGTRIMAATAPVAAAKSRLLRWVNPYMTGADVRNVQARTGAGVDGAFGRDTDAHVRGFQRRHWPTTPSMWDGIAGPLTCRALGIAWVA